MDDSDEALMARIREGLPDYGMNAVGEGMDSDGSEFLIEVVERSAVREIVPVIRYE